MDSQDFISSGIIELYMAGIATEQEVRELEAAMAQFPEVAAQVETYRRNMEAYIEMQGIDPQPGIKTSLFSKINNEPNLQEEAFASDEELQPSKVVSMQETKSLSWKWIATVAAVLLIGSLILNYVFFNRYKLFREYKDKYESLLLSQNSILSKSNLYKSRLEQMQESMEIIQDPKVLKVPMPGTKAFPEALATVFWNPSSQQVYLKVNKLPEPAADKQYQLWAIVDGKPVDMGVFEMGDTASLLQKMKVTGKAQMFAVTLEKKGGAASPTMEQMYVAGKIPG
ncbi:anti-sigma factor [Chitinophaga sp.]|uniref:anti-sigma factor n=1 Tax=Chitinophaga sp. TaxID=1869181 RepID=UPI0025C21CC9|nr:anti-sigma factor [Chitinophaga sp.]